MKAKRERFERELDKLIQPYIDRNIILFGYNRSAYCLKCYLKERYNKDIKGIIDLWERSKEVTILHLYSFFYLYDENDVILNMTELDVIEEFEKCEESWSDIRYRKEQIVDVLRVMYPDRIGASIDYYDWLEVNYGIDFVTNIRRKDIDGEDAHGYYPTEYNVLARIFKDHSIGADDAAFDFGCGKGAMLTMLYQFGFRRLGGVEYTSKVYEQLIRNMELLSLPYKNNDCVSDKEGIYLYRDDAANMGSKLDSFNWFCLFNPFGMSKTNEVIDEIISSLERTPREIHILYAEPMGDHKIMASGRFTRKEYRIDFYEGTYWTYVYSGK